MYSRVAGDPLGVPGGVRVLRLERADERAHRGFLGLLQREVGGERLAGDEDRDDEQRDDHRAVVEVERAEEDAQQGERVHLEQRRRRTSATWRGHSSVQSLSDDREQREVDDRERERRPGPRAAAAATGRATPCGASALKTSADASVASPKFALLKIGLRQSPALMCGQ